MSSSQDHRDDSLCCLRSVLGSITFTLFSAHEVECTWMDETLKTDRKRRQKEGFMGRARALFSRCCDPINNPF